MKEYIVIGQHKSGCNLTRTKLIVASSLSEAADLFEDEFCNYEVIGIKKGEKKH